MDDLETARLAWERAYEALQRARTEAMTAHAGAALQARARADDAELEWRAAGLRLLRLVESRKEMLAASPGR